MLIIDRLELTLEPGLNVLTGETGAGKSILLDSFGFVLGWRGRADLVREGAEQGEVVAEFDLGENHPARDILDEAGLPSDETLILRRTNGRDGRKTSYVNDRRVSGETLRRLSDVLVELHGQHDDKGLLNPRGHRALLDAFGRIDVSQTRNAWKDMQTARKALQSAEARVKVLQDEEDFLRHAVDELDSLAPEAGEDASLDAARRLMQGAERIRDDVAKAQAAIGQDGAEALMNDAVRWLDGASATAEGALDRPVAALARAMNELAEAQDGIAEAIERLDFDESELERVEERLFAIRALARKHGVAPDALPEFADDLREKRDALDQSGSDLKALQRAVADAEDTYKAAASLLSSARRAAAKTLDAAMANELGPLKMERAVFTTVLAETEAGPDGVDEVTFRVATNPGAPAGALNKIASGGELSRFLLALKVCLTSDAEGVTMIFDEIDRGVGGATADAVGRRLEALAKESQILVVTHSPQVAARAGHHWRVEKAVSAGITLSKVTSLGPGERIDELARMLAGDTVTDEARGAAKALLHG